MTPSFDTSLLRAFVTVAELRSFTRAARLLHVTQSGISLQIRRLEEVLEVQLLDRGRRGVRLTAAGEAFIVYARRILELSDEAASSVRSSAVRSDLRFGTPDVYAIRYLPRVLAQLRDSHPAVHPEITCAVSTEIVERFERGELDVCLTVKHDPETKGTILGTEEIHWVAGPSFVLAPDEPVPLALYPERCIYREWGLRALAGIGRDWRIVYTTQSSRAIEVAVTTGYAVAIRSRGTIEPGWRVLGDAQGLPPIGPVELELRRSPAHEVGALKDFCRLLESDVRADLG